MTFLLRIALLLLVLAPSAQGQTWRWASNSGTNRNDNLGAIAANASGNTFIAGSFSDTMRFGDVMIESDAPAIYLAKYDASGRCVFARTLATGPVISVLSVSADPTGAIVLTGRYLSSAQFHASATVFLQSFGSYDAFVARLDEDGELMWVKSIGSSGADFGGSVCTDNTGNVYVTGDMHVTQFEASGSKIFINKYSPAGDSIWAKLSIDYTNGTYGNAIALDASGNVFVAGQYFAGLQFPGAEKLVAGNIESNIFLLKLSNAGELLWSRTAGGGAGYAGGTGVAIDDAGSAYLSGFYRGDIQFGAHGISSTSGTAYELFVARFSADGEDEWVTRTGNPANYGGIVATQGKCYLAGSFKTQIALGPLALTAHGPLDCFIAQLSAQGEFEWAEQYGGDSLVTVAGMASAAHSLFVAGRFLTNVSFGPSITLSGDTIGFDVYVGRFILGAEGVHLEESSNISVTPSPAHQSITVLGINEPFVYQIYDMKGVELISGTLSREISIARLSPAAYTIVLDRGDGQISLPFIKE